MNVQNGHHFIAQKVESFSKMCVELKSKWGKYDEALFHTISYPPNSHALLSQLHL